MTRAGLSLRRWADVLWMSLLGVALVGVVGAVNVELLDRLANLSPVVVAASLLTVVSLVWHWLRQPPARALLGVRHFHTYPPAWVAGVMGTGILLSGLSLSADARHFFRLPSDSVRPFRVASGTCVGLVLLLIPLSFVGARIRARGRRSAPESEAALVPLHASWERLRRWIPSDEPVTTPENDAFGHLPIARRIARRLEARPMAAQAVVGELGAGKTTLRHLVAHELGAGSSTHIIAVELWPYDTPAAAVEGVLRSLQDGVAREVSVLAARGLPERYSAAMGAAGSLSSAIANLAGKARSPFDVLETVDRIATTIGHRFVVWVEDLERFAGSATGDESLEHSQRLAPLRALLFGLSERTSIGVVTATTSLHARFDTEKIARFVEELPPLEAVDAARVLQCFRTGCLQEPFIDPALAEVRRDWAGFDDPKAQAVREAFGGGIHSVTEAAVALCRTPRSMKHALRHVLAAWEKLRGEIDFDDLLVMHLLRVAEPAAFAVVRSHWNGVSGSHMIEDARKAARKSFEEALGALVLRGERASAVGEVVKSVFSRGTHAKPQGVAIRRYWLRFLSEPDLSRTERDQPVLRTLQGDDDGAVLDLLETEQSQQVENFARQLTGERLLRLLVPLVERRRSEDPSTWFDPADWPTGQPPGMIPLWRMIGDRRATDAPSANAICDELIRAFEAGISNLHLIHELEYYFASPEEGDGRLYVGGLDEGRRLAARARDALWELLVTEFSGKPDALATALQNSPPWTLARVVWGSLRIHRKVLSGKPFARWDELAPTVLAACAASPATMLPQLAALVTQERGTQHDGRVTIYEFDVTRTRELFGNAKEVLRLFRKPRAVDSNATGMVSAVSDVAATIDWSAESVEVGGK